MAARYSLTPYACDYISGLMKTPGQKVELVDLSRENLPYQNAHFGLVTCIETSNILKILARPFGKFFVSSNPVDRQ